MLIAMFRPICAQAAILSTVVVNDHDTITLHYNVQIAASCHYSMLFSIKVRSHKYKSINSIKYENIIN